MALTIQLWIDGELARGAEGWWDDVATAIGGDSARYALAKRIDPYSLITFSHDQLATLRAELNDLLGVALPRAHEFILTLIDLCDRGIASSNAELRFIGD